jgi:hypothetical protein
LAVLREIGLFRAGEYPLALSVADLEMIGLFCEGPEIFLHYVERRLTIQKHPTDVRADELDLWGAYLGTRLQAAGIRLNDDFSAMLLTGYSEQFDRWVVYQRGGPVDAPDIKLKIPEEIRWVLHELRSRQDVSARWISFAILDMPDSLLKALAEDFQKIWTAQLTPDAFRVAVLPADNIVISLVGSLDQPLAQLEERTKLRTSREKYRTKVSRSIGFGIRVSDKSRPFHSAIWIEETWEKDPEMDRLLEDGPPVAPVPGGRPPGRNEPCFCGSGKKFKKCHWTEMKQV